jgi:hypothetical protein
MTGPAIIPPEQNDQSQVPQDQQNNNPPQLDTNTQGVQNPPVQPTNNNVNDLYRQAYEEQYRRTQELESRIAAQEAQRQQPARQVTDEEFFNQPATNYRALIREELSAALGTLPEEIRNQSRMTAYRGLKDQFRSHPDYPDFSEHEAGIDQIINSGNVEPTIQGINNAVLYLRGMKYTQTLKNPALNILNNHQSQNPVNPPYVPPSAPPAPRQQQNDIAAKVNGLTEAERTVARARGITLEQFVLERDNPNPGLLYDPNPQPAK